LVIIHFINLDKSCQDIFGGIIPLFCHIPKKRNTLSRKMLEQPASARGAITHEQDMPAVGFAWLRQCFDQLVVGGGGGGRRNDGIGILAERDMI